MDVSNQTKRRRRRRSSSSVNEEEEENLYSRDATQTENSVLGGKRRVLWDRAENTVFVDFDGVTHKASGTKQPAAFDGGKKKSKVPPLRVSAGGNRTTYPEFLFSRSTDNNNNNNSQVVYKERGGIKQGEGESSAIMRMRKEDDWTGVVCGPTWRQKHTVVSSESSVCFFPCSSSSSSRNPTPPSPRFPSPSAAC